MTTRSKPWYRKTSRLANSLRKASIGSPFLVFCWQQDHRMEDRGSLACVLTRPGCWGERFPRPEGLAEGSPIDPGRLSDPGELSPRGVIGADEPTAALVFFDLGQSGRGMRSERRCRTSSLLLDRPGISQRAGLPPAAGPGSEADQSQILRRTRSANQGSQAYAGRAPGEAES